MPAVNPSEDWPHALISTKFAISGQNRNQRLFYESRLRSETK